MTNKNKSESNTLFYAKNGSRIGLIAITYIVFAATSYHYLESWSWLDSFYFVVVTMATVGYGDITPHTTNGRLFTIFFIIFGIAIFSAAITDLSRRSRERREARKASRNKDK